MYISLITTTCHPVNISTTISRQLAYKRGKIYVEVKIGHRNTRLLREKEKKLISSKRYLNFSTKTNTITNLMHDHEKLKKQVYMKPGTKG